MTGAWLLSPVPRCPESDTEDVEPVLLDDAAPCPSVTWTEIMCEPTSSNVGVQRIAERVDSHRVGLCVSVKVSGSPSGSTARTL
jgi:hypothetical protein